MLSDGRCIIRRPFPHSPRAGARAVRRTSPASQGRRRNETQAARRCAVPPRTGALKGRREQRRWSGRPGEQGHALSSVPMGGSGLHGSLEMGGERSQVLWAQHGRAEGRGLRPVPVGRAEQGGAAHSDHHPWKAALAKRRTAGHAGEAGGPVLSVQISRGAQLGHHSSPRSLGHGELERRRSLWSSRAPRGPRAAGATPLRTQASASDHSPRSTPSVTES